MSTIMTSDTLVAKLYADLQRVVNDLLRNGVKPKLAIVLVGNDSNSEIYVSVKQKRAEELGIGFELHHLAELVTEEEVIQTVAGLNANPAISGIIVQLPLPKHINTDNVLGAIVIEKDVDGLRSDSSFMPTTVKAIFTLLEEYDIELDNKNIVVVGKGRLVGGPLIEELAKRGLSVKICDRSTSDLKACTIEADILISATGQEHLIQPNMIKQGAVVIDVERDVTYDEVITKVSHITPHKGGIGPLTVALLLTNVVKAAQDQNRK